MLLWDRLCVPDLLRCESRASRPKALRMPGPGPGYPGPGASCVKISRNLVAFREPGFLPESHRSMKRAKPH